MYPAIRFVREMARARAAPRLPLDEVHVSHHRCWPWDLDPWRELNNGRALTLYDLGRIPMARRMGLIDVLRREGWGLTVAGSSTRYRRRVRLFDRIEMRSRLAGWDARFLYAEQAMWVRGDCAGHVLIRGAVVGPEGIVPMRRVLDAMGHDGPEMVPPDWIRDWIRAEEARPWPPMTGEG